jgi:ribosome-binding protein aMBF1 (putative translation factor)
MKKTQRNIAARKPSKTSTRRLDGVDLLENLIARDRTLREMVDQATLNAMVAQLIYQARTEAGLTQARLARLVGTRQSVVSRLEDADYEGHSLSMLRRIAEALGKRLEVRFVDPSNRAA